MPQLLLNWTVQSKFVIASRTASLERHVSQVHSIICTYNISNVERCKYSGNFVKGLRGGKGIKTYF